MGNNVDALFWRDPWLDGGVLKFRFSRLFHLADIKMAMVVDRHYLCWREGSKAWKWRRRLLAWEEEHVRELCELLNPIVLLANMTDR